MESNLTRETPDDPRTGFVRSLPRKIVEIKATFGALIADPRSMRMRDELRRKLHALYTLTRSYQLSKLSEAVRACVDIIDATKSMPALTRPHIDSLAGYIASFSQCVEADTHEASSPAAAAAPTGTREDAARSATVRLSAAPGALPRGSIKATLPPDFSAALEAQSDAPRISQVPHRTLPPGTTLRKGAAVAAHGAAVHVLFVGSSARANALHEALPSEVELLVTRSAADAAQRARDVAPDVIVAEMGGAADGAALVATLRADPITEFFPVVLVAPPGEGFDAVRERCPEAADVVSDALDGAGLWDVLERVLGGAAASMVSAHDFGDVTLDELTRALQDEIRRGIVGAASPRARGARIPLGAGNEVLVAAWEAIARIREVVERRSHGAVRFELPTAPRGLPGTHVVTLGDDVKAAVEAPGDDPLPGRTVLVVDDDPAVVTNFTALLREAGAEVTGCASGAEALATARRTRPDLVISDIVMPGLDGFGLCQAIRRDPTLRHTPVVLLSWRDDLLVRMREMGAQAQGYLRKEAGGEAVLARARDAIRLRVRILKRVTELTGSAEVRGRLERVGLAPLLHAAAAALGDATVTISDPWSVTELHVRGGRLASALRTAHDGSLLRGDGAMVPVMGAATARFAVARSKTHARENLQGDLDEVLSRCARKIVAFEESLTGASLLEVVRVEIDRDAALAYGRTLPARMSAIVERVATGEAPRDLILRDAMAPADLEPLLVELARRGAIQRVLDARGDDLTALRMASIESVAPPPLAAPQRPVAIAPRPAAASAADDAEGVASLADAVFRELRDSVHDEPLLRKRPSGANEVPPPRATPAREAPALPQPPPANDDLPPLPEMGEAFEPVKTPAAPMPARLIAESIPRPGARADELAPDRVETRKVAHAPAVVRDRDELASTAPSTHDVKRAFADDAMLTRELPDGMLDALKGEVEASTRAERSAPLTPRAATPATPPSATESAALRARSPAASPVRRPPTPPPQALTARAGNVRPRTPDATGPQKAQPDATGPQKAQPDAARATPSAATRSSAPDAVRSSSSDALRSSAPAAGHSAKFEAIRSASDDPTRIAAPNARKSERASAPRPGPGGAWSMRPALLLLGVGAAFAGSYYGVRWYLSHAVPPETVLPIEAPDAGLPLEEAFPVAEAGAAAALAPEPAVVDAGAPTTALAVDASPAGDERAATMALRAAGPQGEYRPAQEYTDGAVLPPRAGLLVVPAEGAPSGLTVQIGARDASAPPVSAVVPEGMHAVRFSVDGASRYQLATVRAGEALVLPAPAGR